MIEVRAISINLSSEIGADDTILWVPIVPDGRDGNIVYARTLRVGESNPGTPVQVNPEIGETLQFRPGSIEISILDVDRHAQLDVDGFAPISNTLWTWLTVGTPLSLELFNHLLATGRRLDGTHLLLRDVTNRMATLSGNFIARRDQFFRAFALAEILVVALGRTIDLAQLLKDNFGVKAIPPAEMTKLAESIRELRNAFEHIEDRAMGRVRGKPHPDAFTIFNQHEFVSTLTLSYGSHRVSLGDDIAPLLVKLRLYILSVAVEVAGPSKQLNQPILFFNAGAGNQ